jgi:regulator of sigma E protease
MTLIYFIIVLGVLVFVHELGHFLVAKAVGIRVTVFSIGYSPKIIGFKRGETEYRLSALPLGGYCSMAGQEEDEEVEDRSDPRLFFNRPAWQRFLVVFSGPLMNVLLCLVLMPIVFMIGREQPVYLDNAPQVIAVQQNSPADKAGILKDDLIVAINGKKVSEWGEVLNKILISAGDKVQLDIDRNGSILKKDVDVITIFGDVNGDIGISPAVLYEGDTTVMSVEKDSPADKAGILAKDKVLSINSERIRSWSHMLHALSLNGGTPIEITIERNGAQLQKKIEPAFNKDYERWLIGIIGSEDAMYVPTEIKKYGFVAAVEYGWLETYKLTIILGDVLKRLVTLKLSYKTLGGPVLIAKASAAAASMGLAAFIYFMAFLSIQLGILNLLPIPVLDGGHILFLAIEKIIRRPIHIKVKIVANYFGLAILVGLIVMITYNDLDRFWGVGKFLAKIFN